MSSHRAFFLALLVLGVCTTLLTFQDYGASWDEPLFYRYADEISTAYDLGALRAGTYDLEAAYSLTDHRYYGPAYLLLARPLVNLLDAVRFPGQRIDHWHLLTSLVFLAGGLSLYALARRWLPPWAAFFAALLYLTQPVLWGHGLINPKDIPFLTLFILTFQTGLVMVDRLTGPVASEAAASPAWDTPAWQRARRVLLPVGTAALAVALIVLVFGRPIENLLAGLVRSAYAAQPGSWLGRLFGALASRGAGIPVDAYVAKLLVWVRRGETAALVLSFPLALAVLAERARPGSLPRLWAAARAFLGRFASLPEIGLTRAEVKRTFIAVLPAALALGLLSAVRVIGPLAGLLVAAVFLCQRGRRSLVALLLYAAAAVLVMFLAWPFLWQAPVDRFIEVLQHMSANPVVVAVQFNGQMIPSDALPAAYLPTLLLLTLTLPVLPLALIGLLRLGSDVFRRSVDARPLAALLAWFLLPLAYLLLRRPPMYDGYRHFLFILPPLFVLAGAGIHAAGERLPMPALKAGLMAVLLIPGLSGAARAHPYTYAYFNNLAGGVQGAFRRFDTEYWLTCYKHIIEQQVNPNTPPGAVLYALREPRIAQLYVKPGIEVQRYRQGDLLPPGSLLLLTTRMNADQVIYPDAPIRYTEGLGSALFCVVKEIPPP